MKKTILSSAFAVAFAASAMATNISVIDFSGTTSNVITSSLGVPTASATGYLRIGYFNSALVGQNWASNLRSDILSNVNDAMLAFVPLGESAGAPMGTGIGTATGPRYANRTINGVAETGRLAGQITNVSSTTGAPNSISGSGVPAGTRIFLLAYSGGDAALGIEEEFGVFSADTWVMPADSGLNLQLNTTAVDTEGEIYRGSFGSLRLAGFIPEPSSALSVILAVAGISLRRRR
jgi:hypothetical protein